MAAKKTTKKSTKKTSKTVKKDTRKKVAKKPSEKKSVQPSKKETADDTITIKMSYLYGGIIVLGLVIVAILITKSDVFSSTPLVEGITIVSDENCVTCRTEEVKTALEQLFPNAQITEIDVNTDKGKELMNLGVSALPAYFFNKELDQTQGFKDITSKFSDAFISAGNLYYLHPGIVNPGEILNEIDIEGAHVLGNDDAPVTIIEFSDFECPFCKRFYDQTYETLKKQYIDTGKAKLVFKHFPLPIHSKALNAALAAECAGEQGKFWEYHNLLFENQESLSEDNYKAWATELGLNSEQFNNCLDSNKYEEKVKSDMEQGSNNYIGGTPTFIVNKQILVGALPISAFEQVIE